MTIYRLKTPKEGEVKKEGNYTYKFINGEWRIIYYKDDEGTKHWCKYDNEGHLIYYKITKELKNENNRRNNKGRI